MWWPHHRKPGGAGQNPSVRRPVQRRPLISARLRRHPSVDPVASTAAARSLLGHQVTLRDSAVSAGGMMRFGIPAYRLSRDVLDSSRILDAVTLLHSMEGAERPSPGLPRGRLRRRKHRDGRGQDRAAPRRNRRCRGLPPHQRQDARPRGRGRGSDGRGSPDDVALHDRPGRRAQASSSRRSPSMRPASRSQPASSPNSMPTLWCWPSAP